MISIDFKRLRVLIIGDSAQKLRLLRTVLRGFGVREVNEAEDGANGLQDFAVHAPDIVITNLVLPKLDGIKLIQSIRQPEASANPFVPIIVVSGQSEWRHVSAARDAGANEFLAIPFSPKDLHDRILSVVACSRPFIKTKTYFGPDRHRTVNKNYFGPERRNSSKASKADGAENNAAAAREGQELTARQSILASPKNNGALITVTRNNHEFIVPKNKLRKAVITKQYRLPGDDDPVKNAERALATEFWPWMNSECDRLNKIRHDIANGGLSEPSKNALFNSADDIRNQALSLGFPLVAGAVDSLCKLLEKAPDMTRIPFKLIEQHVDTVRAIHREYAKSDAKELAAKLNTELSAVTDEFLSCENR